MTRVLVVGQTPPPFGGQAIMIANLLDGQYDGVELHHVRMNFSKEMDTVGRFRVAKILVLMGLIVRIVWCRIRYRTPVLYYPPAGPSRIPFYRDIVILLVVRWMFSSVIFHFHAGGVSEFLEKQNSIVRWLGWHAYRRPTCAIVLSDRNPPDGERLGAERNVVIGNGVEDAFATYKAGEKFENRVPRVLNVGLLSESKGTLTLIEACHHLAERGVAFRLDLVGHFVSVAFEDVVRERIAAYGLSSHVVHHGVLIGQAKWDRYAQADLFCYPSFFESETFGLVVLEAMQFELPVVVSDWRAIPSLVKEGRSGWVVPHGNVEALARRLEQLLKDRAARREMGQQGRQFFLEKFTIQVWRSKMGRVLRSALCADPDWVPPVTGPVDSNVH